MLTRLLIVLALLCTAAARAEVPVPALQARVTDLTGTLDTAQRAALEQKLAAFERDKGSQVAVLLLPTTQPETLEQYSMRVVERWRLGRERPDDGVLLLVAKNDRALRIEVGYGLEGAIPDALAKRIIEETILPRFRAGDVAGGIEAGVDQILGLIRGEALPPPQARARDAGPLGAAAPLLIVALLIGQVLRRVFGPLLGGLLVGGGLFVLAWLFSGALGMALLLGLAGFVLTVAGLMGGGRGWVSGGGGLRGGFGGGGGGGFRGGGGGFGGGGASGRW